MAIAYDNSAGGPSGGGSSSITWNHTVGTGSDRALFVSVFQSGSSAAVSSVTYNGTALTLIGSTADATSANWGFLYYLLNPVSGTNAVVVSFSTSPTASSGASSSFTGVLQSGQPDVYATGNNNSTASFTVGVTTTVNNDWLVGAFRVNSSPVAGANTTIRAISGYGTSIADSNASQSPAGAFSLTETYSTAVDGWIGVVAGIKPAPSVASTTNASFLLNFV